MGIFNEFHKKEKPVFTGIARGVGGFAFGTGPSTGGTGSESNVLASGGFISEYTDDSTVYVAHIFTGPGTFDLPTANAPQITNLEYLMVGGGGAGGDGDVGGGGGAGAYVKNSVPAASNSGSYTISIGAGQPGSGSSGRVAPAGDTSIAFPSGTLYSYGGGAGGAGNPAPAGFRLADNMGPGNGSAGGNGYYQSPNPTTALGTYPGTISDNTPALGWGGGGGAAPSVGGGGGGGAAGNGGNQVDPSDGGTGGDGLPSDGFSPTPLANGGVGIVAAGGGGGADGSGGTGGSGAVGGSGSPPSGGGPPIFPSPKVGLDAIRCTGSGGGGGGGYSFGRGGYGSNGVAIIRYAVPSPGGTNIATGGLIAYNNGKCIHTFINPGSFVAPSQITNVNYLIIGGGGSGSTVNHGGGGGSGALIYKEGVTLPATTYPIQVGEGANHGFNGQSSTFNGLTAAGGSGTTGQDGGQSGVNSPHPGGIDVTTPDTGVGGVGGTADPTYAGGGGGASAAGENGNTTPGAAGDGGDGARYTIHMGNEPGTEIYFAGGGGGGGHTGSPSPKAAGGQGGGGEGGLFWNNPSPAPFGGAEAGDIGFPGANGFGGGAGGTGKFAVGGTPGATSNARPATYASAAKGGSGVVIIAYPI